MNILTGAVLALLTVAALPAAAAGPWRDFGGGRIDVQAPRHRPGDFQRPPHQDFRRSERPPEHGKRGDGRLTDQERRDLRRDIDRAGREIYKGRPSR